MAYCTCHVDQCMGMRARNNDQSCNDIHNNSVRQNGVTLSETASSNNDVGTEEKVDNNGDDNEDDDSEDEFHDCLSWGEVDLEVGVDIGAIADIKPETRHEPCRGHHCVPPGNVQKSSYLWNYGPPPYTTHSLPKNPKDSANRRMRWLNHQAPPHKIAPDGTTVHYWCDMPPRRGSFSNRSCGMSFIIMFCYSFLYCCLM